MSTSTRIRTRRKELGLSQQRLAEKAGLALSQVSKLEQGAITDPHVSTVRKLAKALEISVCELIEEGSE